MGELHPLPFPLCSSRIRLLSLHGALSSPRQPPCSQTDPVCNPSSPGTLSILQDSPPQGDSRAQAGRMSCT